MDNGEVERLIKLIVLGRKNWLFLGSDAAGHRAASVYSLVLSCYRLGMDAWACLRDVLPKLGDTRFPASRLTELLPESWAQQQAQQRYACRRSVHLAATVPRFLMANTMGWIGALGAGKQ